MKFFYQNVYDDGEHAVPHPSIEEAEQCAECACSLNGRKHLGVNLVVYPNDRPSYTGRFTVVLFVPRKK